MMINFQPPKSLFDDYEIQEAMHSKEARKYLYQIVIQDIQRQNKSKEEQEQQFPDDEMDQEKEVYKYLEHAPLLNDILRPRALPKKEPLFTGWGSHHFWQKFNWAWDADTKDDYIIGTTEVQMDGHNQVMIIDATNERTYFSSVIPISYEVIHPVYNTLFVQAVQCLKHQIIIPFGNGLMLGMGASFLEYLQQSFDRIEASDVLGPVASENINYHVDNFSPIPGKLQGPNHVELTEDIFAPGSDMREMMRSKEQNELWFRLPTRYTDAGYTPVYTSPYDDSFNEHANWKETLHPRLPVNEHLWRIEDWSWAHPDREKELRKYSSPSYVAQTDPYERKYRHDYKHELPTTPGPPSNPWSVVGSATQNALKGLSFASRSYFSPFHREK